MYKKPSRKWVKISLQDTCELQFSELKSHLGTHRNRQLTILFYDLFLYIEACAPLSSTSVLSYLSSPSPFMRLRLPWNVQASLSLAEALDHFALPFLSQHPLLVTEEIIRVVQMSKGVKDHFSSLRSYISRNLIQVYCLHLWRPLWNMKSFAFPPDETCMCPKLELQVVREPSVPERERDG